MDSFEYAIRCKCGPINWTTEWFSSFDKAVDFCNENDKVEALHDTTYHFERRESTQGWQPIDTVSRDGEWIIGYFDWRGGAGDNIKVIRWNGTMWVCGLGIETFTSKEPLTHWRPLPAPPE